MRRSRTAVLSTAVLAVVALLLLPTPAAAFKLKSHVMSANRARDRILATGARALDLPGIGLVPVQNDDAMEAIERFPAYFRAGAVGPDGYPDLFAGQLWVHVNGGNPKNLECSDPASCVDDGVPVIDGGVRFEERRLAEWRAVDYGMLLLDRAFRYRQGATGAGRDERLQAIAFAYGYLSHMVADGASHGFINEWAKAWFDYTHGNPGALFGPPTEEIQHMAVEGYIDLHVAATDEELEIATPIAFLNSVLRAQLGTADGLRQAEPAGAFGGLHYVKLIEARNLLGILADSTRWSELAGLQGWSQELADLSLHFQGAVGTALSLGTDLGNPLRDLEDLFARRRTMVDAVLERWVQLSGCVNQNLLRGSNRGPGDVVATDACAAIDFESDPAVRDVFDGALNEAAWYGRDTAHFDFGRIGANVRKQEGFLRTVLTRGLLVSPTEDLRSIRLIKDAITDCSFRLVGWGSCDSACQAAHQRCTTVVTRAACLSCPKDGDDFDCGGWNALACAAEPHCFGCATDATETVVNAACVTAVNSAAPVCDVCSVNAVCANLQAASAVIDTLEAFPKALIEQVLDPAMDEVKAQLLAVFAGPYANDLMRAYHEFERRRPRAKASWFVNLAFLKEDLRSAAGAAHLNGILAATLGTAGDVVSGNTSLDAAIEETYQRTAAAGVSVLRAYVTAADDAAFQRIWRGFVAVLLRVARDDGFNPLRDFARQDFGWLDEFTLADGEHYETRFGRWVGLVAQVADGLLDVRGPTARLLRQSMRMNADPVDDGTEALALDTFHPSANAIRLTELGFLGAAGLRELGARAGLSFASDAAPFGFTPAAFEQGRAPGAAAYRPSKICSDRPHVACDAIQSLDDPNHYGHPLRAGTSIHAPGAVDPNRSVSSWESRPNVYDAPTCALGVTNFLLAGRVETLGKVYSKLFLAPEYCQKPDLAVEEVRVSPDAVGPGGTVVVTVTVRNLGLVTSPTSTVRIQLSSEAAGIDTAIPALPPWQVYSAQRSATATAIGAQKVTARVDPGELLTELGRGNNEGSATFQVVAVDVGRLSVAADGTQATQDTRVDAVSFDGRYVVMTTWARNLVPGGTGYQDVVLRDRTQGSIERVGVASDGTLFGRGATGGAVTGDGRLVAFTADPSGNDAGDGSAVYVRDRTLGRTECVSVDASGACQPGREPSLSADGRYVAFLSNVPLLPAEDTNRTTDVYVRDRVLGTTSRVSRQPDGSQDFRWASTPVLSADGRCVAYVAVELGSTYTYGAVRVHDLVAGTTQQLANVFGGYTAQRYPPTIGAVTPGCGLVAWVESTMNRGVIYSTTAIRNLQTGQQSGVQGRVRSVSADGRLFAYGTIPLSDVFLWDADLQKTTKVSVTASGAAANGTSDSPRLSGDGRVVVYESRASNLVAGDTNGVQDVFVYAAGAATPSTGTETRAFSVTIPVPAFETPPSRRLCASTPAAAGFVVDRWSGRTAPGFTMSSLVVSGSALYGLPTFSFTGGAVEVCGEFAPGVGGTATISGTVHVVPDADGDGIADGVDGDAGASVAFGDARQGGGTSGTIRDRGDQSVVVVDAPAPRGVRVASAGGGTRRATVEVCGGAASITLGPGVDVVATCGSATVEALHGVARVALAASSGTTSSVDLPAGNGFRFDPATSSVTASAGNFAVLLVQVPGGVVALAPGATSGVGAVNAPPVARPGPPLAVEAVDVRATPVRIDGSASRDPEGGALTYRWTGPFPQGDGVLSGPAGDVTLPLGTHQLTLRVTDPQGASAEASQLVTVRDTTAPVVVAPATLTVQATGAGTAVGLAPPAARDVSPLTFRSNAPPLFPLGDTVVTWTITDAAGNAAVARQLVRVVDSTPPVLIPPPDVRKEAIALLTPVDLGAATARDLFPVTILNDAPASFPLGPTVVRWSAADSSRNQASATQLVTIVDTTPPDLLPPADVVAEATGPLTAVVLGEARASDIFPVTVAHVAPLSFPPGPTWVDWFAVDPSSNVARARQLVLLRDTTPPRLDPPPPATVECAALGGTPATSASVAAFLAAATARDLVDPAPVVVNDAPATFPVGATNVLFTATDAAGNAAVALSTLTVVDGTPPAASAALARHGRVTAREGEFVVRAGCADTCTLDVSATALLNGIPVRDGQRVRLELAHRTEVHREHGRLHELEAPAFTLEVTCRDASANTSHASATPAFQDPCPPHRRPGHPPHRGDRAAGCDDDHPAPPHVHARR